MECTMLPSIAIDPPSNIDFYSNDLGPRLVKFTLNQDDAMSHHLYFGDKTSRLGTILTFFHWQEIPIGCRGTCLIYLANRYYCSRVSGSNITKRASKLSFTTIAGLCSHEIFSYSYLVKRM